MKVGMRKPSLKNPLKQEQLHNIKERLRDQ